MAAWARTGFVGPVHSVCVDAASGVVLSASGPYVRAHALATGEALLEADALPDGRIHSVQLEPGASSTERLLVVHGQKQLRLFRLSIGARPLGLEPAGTWACPDWVLASQLCSSGGVLVAALAHNELLAFPLAGGSPTRVRPGAPPTLMASAAVREAGGGRAEVAFGSFFGDVLVWAADLAPGAPAGPPERLAGARGKVARLRWCEGGGALLSAGEDRTVRLWRRGAGGRWSLALAALGHEGWVWDCALLPALGVVASVGEDLVLRAFDAATGLPCAALKGHSGRHVWCLAAHEPSGVVVTGGEDASVKVWDLRAALEEGGVQGSAEGAEGWRDVSVPLPHAGDASGVYVKGLAVLGGGARCLAALSTGELVALYPLLSPSEPPRLVEAWRPEGGTGPRPISCMDAAGDGAEDRAVLGSPFGPLTFVRILAPPSGGPPRSWAACLPSGDPSVLDVFHPLPCLALSAEPRPGGLLRSWIVAGPKGVGEEGPPRVRPGPPLRTADGHRVTCTAAADRGDAGILLFCGDKRGNLTVFRIQPDARSDGPLTPAQTLYRLHGKESVFRALLAAGGTQLWTVGGDGCLARAALAGPELRPVCSQKVAGGVGGAPEGAWEAAGGDALVAGFLSSSGQLVFWNVTQAAAVGSVPVAGFKQVRASAVLPSGRGLVCVRAAGGALLAARRGADRAPARSLGCPFHGREVRAVCALPLPGAEAALATAGEDTSVRLLSGLRPVLSLHAHAGAVRCLAAAPLGENSALLLSGGAGEALVAWRVERDPTGDPGQDQGSPIASKREREGRTGDPGQGPGLRCGRLASDEPPHAGADQRVLALALSLDPPLAAGEAAGARRAHVAAALSDSTVRLFELRVGPSSSSSSSSSLRRAGPPLAGHSGAVLSLCALEPPPPNSDEPQAPRLLFSGATDGVVCCWAWPAADGRACLPTGQASEGGGEQWQETTAASTSMHAGCRNRRRPPRARREAGGELEAEGPEPLARWPTHQLGVNCLAAARLPGGTVALASGGDDQSVCVRWLRGAEVAAEARLEAAHASAVKGLRLFPVQGRRAAVR